MCKVRAGKEGWGRKKEGSEESTLPYMKNYNRLFYKSRRTLSDVNQFGLGRWVKGTLHKFLKAFDHDFY